MKKLIASLIIFPAFGLASLALHAQMAEYPDEVKKNFMDACMKRPSERQKKYCECTLDKLRERYTFDEFADIDQRLQRGESLPDFEAIMKKIVEECGQGL